MHFRKSVFVLIFFGMVLNCGVGQNIIQKIYQQHDVNTPKRTMEKECPDHNDIYPCNCTNTDGNLDLDCSLVEDYQQLQNVLLTDFPDKTFRTFRIEHSNNIEKIGNDLFQDLTFEIIDLEYMPSFKQVDNLAFIGSLLTLKELRIIQTQIDENTFPFEILNDFTQLIRIDFYGNQIKSIPKLNIPTLTWMSFLSNFIRNVDNDTFKLVPNVRDILLDGNFIKTISSGTFAGLKNLKFLSLSENEISEVQDNSIVLNEGILHLYLNNITTFSDHSIAGASTVYLLGNSIRKLLSEDAWISIFEDAEGDEAVVLRDNALDCGCDLLFLVTNPSYMRKLDSKAECENGVLVSKLDPETFINNCS